MAALLLGAAATPGLAQVPEGNADNGQRLFNQCRACHTVDQGGRNGVGPNLYQVYGRAAGGVQGFNYSPNLRERAAGGLVWNEENLRSYLSDPKVLVPQGRMSFPGFRDNQQNISDVIAYIRRVGGN
ncbi:MAG: cytochrome c family protein [Acetobacteraceae bacterium]|nr:cytochrome c family protein [Acetobacteraceae bacterium]